MKRLNGWRGFRNSDLGSGSPDEARICPDLPRSAPICSGDEVASADFWTWLSAAAEPWMVVVLMGS